MPKSWLNHSPGYRPKVQYTAVLSSNADHGSMAFDSPEKHQIQKEITYEKIQIRHSIGLRCRAGLGSPRLQYNDEHDGRNAANGQPADPGWLQSLSPEDGRTKGARPEFASGQAHHDKPKRKKHVGLS